METTDAEVFQAALDTFNNYLNIREVHEGVLFEMRGQAIWVRDAQEQGLVETKLLEHENGKLVHPEGAPEGTLTEQVKWAVCQPQFVAMIQVLQVYYTRSGQ